MKFNLRSISCLFAIPMVVSCSSYQAVKLSGGEELMPIACKNPTYVATMAKSSFQKVKDDEGDLVETFNQASLSLYFLLEDARRIYGPDVTIQNVRWDVRNGRKRISVIYDVVRCN